MGVSEATGATGYVASAPVGQPAEQTAVPNIPALTSRQGFFNSSGSFAIFTAIRRASRHLLPNVAPWLQRHEMSNRRYPPLPLHGVPLLARLVRNEQCLFGQQADCRSSGFLSA